MNEDLEPTLSEDLLNPLERITAEFKDIKKKEAAIQVRKLVLLSDLNDHYYYGNIKNEHLSNGVKIKRKRLPTKYVYSETVKNLEAELKKRKEIERDDNIVNIANESKKYTWAVSILAK